MKTSPEENGWARVFAMLGFIVAMPIFVLTCIGGLCISRCSLAKKVEQHFAAIQQRGVGVRYWVGSKHSPARLIFDVPGGAPMVGAVVVGTAAVGTAAVKQMQVQVPHGCGPGDSLQVQTPEGLTVQANVPAGIMAGQYFTVQYS